MNTKTKPDESRIVLGSFDDEKDDKSVEINIADIFRTLLNHIVMIIVITIIGGAVAFGISKFFMPLKYSSHISMYVQSYTNVSENQNDMYNYINNSKQLVNTYIEVLKDDAVMNAVGKQLENEFDKKELEKEFSYNSNDDIDPASIRKCISISTVDDTSAVNIKATTNDPETAAAICNDVANVSAKYVDEAVGIGTINTIDKAKVYKNAISPSIPKNTVIGAGLGFIFAILMVIFAEFLGDKIKSSDGIEKRYDKAVIGKIQMLGSSKKSGRKKKKSDPEKRYLLTDKNIPFSFVESYKSLRTNIQFATGSFEKKVIAVSSCNEQEGKSSVSANIAIVFTQAGKRVLLIDADMRKPVMHKIFKTKNDKGLSTLIIKESTKEDSIKKDIIPKLDLLTSGKIPPNPSELLASEEFKNIIDDFSKEYDYIIIDTPPANVVSDAISMKDSICGLLLVLAYNKTTNKDLATCIKQLKFADVNLLGFVLNEIKGDRGSYYYKYNYKYKYGE